MRTSEHSSGLIGSHDRHAEQVYLVTHGDRGAPELEEVSTSWRRCADDYGVDSTASEAPNILTGTRSKTIVGRLRM